MSQWQETGLSILTSSPALPRDLFSCSKWNQINHRLRIAKTPQISVTQEEHTYIVGCTSFKEQLLWLNHQIPLGDFQW